eukprot:Pgem_evm1s13082
MALYQGINAINAARSENGQGIDEMSDILNYKWQKGSNNNIRDKTSYGQSDAGFVVSLQNALFSIQLLP